MWTATKANMVYLYRIRDSDGKNIFTILKLVFEDVLNLIMVKSYICPAFRVVVVSNWASEALSIWGRGRYGGDGGPPERGVRRLHGGGGGSGGGPRAVGRREEDGGHGRRARGLQAALGTLPRRLRPRRGARRVHPPAHRLRVPRRRGHGVRLRRIRGRPRHQAHQRRPPRADEQGRPVARHRAPARHLRPRGRRQRRCRYPKCRRRGATPRGGWPVGMDGVTEVTSSVVLHI